MVDESSRRYLFVAIDRATWWVFIRIYNSTTVLPKMAELIDATPKDQTLILLNVNGHPHNESRALQVEREWRDKAGLSTDLRLQDARGTATTRLLNAGLTLAELASHTGWSIRHTAAVIEHYARVSPDESDAILIKLALANGGAA